MEEDELDASQDEFEDRESDDEPSAAKRRKTGKGKAVATKGKGQKVTKAKKPTAMAKGKGKSKRQGSLEGLLDMPMDVFFEILCHLEPEYLLNLSRMNQQFRTSLMSPQSRFVWKAARYNVHGTPAPDPPTGVTEPAWANLLYTPQSACFECGKAGTNFIDFAFRRRLCLACRKEHLLRMTRSGNQARLAFDSEVFPLVPFTTSGGYFGGLSGHPVSYWIPELKAMESTVAEFKDNIKAGRANADAEYDAFKKSRALKVKSIVDTVKDLEAWVHKKEREQYMQKADKKDQRYNAIVERLVEAGYSKEEVPSQYMLAFDKGLQVNSVRPLNDAAWEKMKPKLMEQLDAARAQKARDERQAKLMTVYTASLNLLLPSQHFLLPHQIFYTSPRCSGRLRDRSKLRRLEELADDPATADLSQSEFEAVTVTAFFADISTSALAHITAIAKAASLSISLPKAVSWVTLDTPSADRARCFSELGKLFDLATAVFLVDAQTSGSSSYYQNWRSGWPSLGPAPELPDSKVVFMGRDTMNMKQPDNYAMIFSKRGADAVRALLVPEHLDPATATTAELDARNSLFKCNHCLSDLAFTWRGCVVHYLLENDHSEPSWSLIPAAEAALFTPTGDRFPARQETKWLCNHCTESSYGTYADISGHVLQSHAVASPQEDIDLVYLPKLEECAPRILSMSRASV
ncbi:hypothetical protein B0H16DRAFT_675958 [Mycena metata]|uniref:F-box domain-containing protein n=1 Tax=Mycena metata TaxID=1033252 RepID=A0AAD7J5Y5_9AGAR|nr:hypothetical protein B0H16DRAFT_675958 [Mycena metata]